MTNDYLARSAATWLVVGLTLMAMLVGLFDLWANLKGRRDLMASVLVWEWSSSHPILPFFLGMLFGHLLWRNAP